MNLAIFEKLALSWLPDSDKNLGERGIGELLLEKEQLS